MAAPNPTLFEQFLKTCRRVQGEMLIEGKIPPALIIQTVRDTKPLEWVYLAHDDTGILVKVPLKPIEARQQCLIRWDEILSIA